MKYIILHSGKLKHISKTKHKMLKKNLIIGMVASASLDIYYKNPTDNTDKGKIYYSKPVG